MFKGLKVVGGGVLAFSVLLFLAARYVRPEAAAAQMQRQVEVDIANKMQPVVVTKINLGNVTVQQGRFVKPVGAVQDPVTPFPADDDWIQNLTVYLFNRTNQTIVYAHFNFSFPETTNWATRFRAVFPLTLGRIPPEAAFENGRAIPQPPGSQPIMFRPGQTMAIRLGDYIDQIKAAVEPHRPLAALTTMGLGPATLFFDGGLRWDGRFRVLDPQTSAWRRIDDPNYFPGDPDGRWPGRPGWVDQQ
jgi:hypothetical protein